MNLIMIQKYNEWCKNVTLDMDLIDELNKIQNNIDEIEDRFYKDLEFGTAGLRGIIGAGTNRMNIYTVMKTTQGLANYLNKNYKDPSVAIAYDSRIKSDVFSKYAACVLAKNKINVHIYKELMPTPSLSYAVRYLKCQAGIVITASHNSSKYNGYKVYGEDGCQITTETAKDILEEINKIDIFNDIKYSDFNLELKMGNIKYIDDEVIDNFIKDISKLSLNNSLNNLKIVYSPLNGTGKKCVLKILERQGYNDVILVKEQENPDGNFPTCPYPNPEKKEALSLGIELAKKTDADIVIATDPDADRVGVAISHNNEYKLITGNEMGILLFNYICENKKMPNKPVCVETIVTTDMVKEIAKKYNVEVRETLTGFKFIGEQIGLLEKENRIDDYIFGFEESYGYLSGSHVRDKDAINASMLICEMTSLYKNNGLTLIDKLDELYKEFGYFKNKLVDYTFEGIDGMSKIKLIMDYLRNNNIDKIDNIKVINIKDYNIKQKSIVDLPLSNVLEFYLENNSKFIARPSGTEPKIKFYIECKGNNGNDCSIKIKIIENYIKNIIQ